MQHVSHRHSDEIHQLKAQIDRLTAEVERLKLALQPFAKYAKRIDEGFDSRGYPDGCPVGLNPMANPEKEIVHLSDLRNARRVLEQ